MSERLLNVKDVSQTLNVKASTVYFWVGQDFIPHYKLGKLVRFREAEILKWLETRRHFGRPNRIPNIELKTGRMQK
jgi:excisionase family DNA binding protein